MLKVSFCACLMSSFRASSSVISIHLVDALGHFSDANDLKIGQNICLEILDEFEFWSPCLTRSLCHKKYIMGTLEVKVRKYFVGNLQATCISQLTLSQTSHGFTL